MWSSSRRVLQDVVTHPSLVRSFSVTSCKNTVIVERWWQVPLAKEGSPATSRLYPRRHRIYKLVEDTTHAPKEKMELILTQTVPKLGGRGDTVSVKKSVGRNKLLPQGLAVYPSPENKDMFAEEMRLLREGTLDERMQTRTGQMTVEFLKRSSLKINSIPPMDNFELTKEIVCRQVLKKLGVVVPPHALRLPDEPIKELGDYWCEVTVNGIDTVRVPMSLMLYEDRLMKKQQEMQPEVVSTAEAAISEAEEVVVKTVPGVVVDSAAEVVEGLETPLATASVMSEASAAQPAEAVEEAAASLETPLAAASVMPEASAAPPAEAVEEAAAFLETPLAEASVMPETSAAPPAEAVASVETPLAEASVMPETSAAPPAEAAASVETPLAEASVMPETSAAPPAEAVEEAAASVETPLAEASVMPEASAAPPAEAVEEAAASVETPLAEASVMPEASAAPPKVSVTAETANDQPVPPTETPKKD